VTPAGSKQLAGPRPAVVHRGGDGAPAALGSVAVESLSEEWVVEDRWWTGRPICRRYFELVLANGRNTVVFLDLGTQRWFEQRG
jgi:hypothetical protein